VAAQLVSSRVVLSYTELVSLLVIFSTFFYPTNLENYSWAGVREGRKGAMNEAANCPLLMQILVTRISSLQKPS
jgi:hypothetical protein